MNGNRADMIRLDRVSKRYQDGTPAVTELTLEVAEGEVCVLVGPSGCGKTTTMKMVNRLIEPSSGSVYLDGEDVGGVDPVRLRRRIGYVIQQGGLFPHLNVADNVATVPRLLRWDRGRRQARVVELLELVGLDPSVVARRYPHQLSGGQRQRVGVARALAADPLVMLMDEPFSAIDPIARDRLQGEFRRLQQEVGKTVLFVTHDIAEAVRLGDRIAVLRDGGHLEQHGTPGEILASPASPFVAEFVGTDRGVKRLGVTVIDPASLLHPPVVWEHGDGGAGAAPPGGGEWAWRVVVDGAGAPVGWIPGDADGEGAARPLGPTVAVGATLLEALSAILEWDGGWVAVVDRDGGRYLGVLTPAAVHGSLRSSLAVDT